MRILWFIFSILLSEFFADGLSSMPTTPMVAFMVFFMAELVIKVHLFPTSWYSRSCCYESSDVLGYKLHRIMCNGIRNKFGKLMEVVQSEG